MSPIVSSLSQSFAVGTTFPKIVTNGLVIYLDAGNQNSYNGTGTIWRDLSGLNNTGTLVNGVAYTNTNGGALVFDGTDDYINFGGFNYNFSAGFTHCAFFTVDTTKAWARLMDFGLGQDNTNILVGQESTSNRLALHTQIGAQSSNQWGQLLSTNAVLAPSTSYRMSAATIAPGTPGTQSSAKLYYNGSEVSTTVVTRQPFVPSTTNRTSNFIGRSNWSADPYWDGNIPITLIYNRELSATEIQQNFQALRGRFGI